MSIEEHSTLVRVPVVVQPIRIPVELRAIPVRARHIPVAVLVTQHRGKYHPLYPLSSSIAHRLYFIPYLQIREHFPQTHFSFFSKTFFTFRRRFRWKFRKRRLDTRGCSGVPEHPFSSASLYYHAILKKFKGQRAIRLWRIKEQIQNSKAKVISRGAQHARASPSRCPANAHAGRTPSHPSTSEAHTSGRPRHATQNQGRRTNSHP